MAIIIPSGLKITNTSPVDTRFVLTKQEMREAIDARTPDVYFAVCSDDAALYLYNKNNTASADTGKYRKFEGGEPNEYIKSAVVSGNKLTLTKKDGTTVVFEPQAGQTYTAGENIQISDQNVISATDTKYTAGTNITIDTDNKIKADAELITLTGESGTLTDEQLAVINNNTLAYISLNGKAYKFSSVVAGRAIIATYANSTGTDGDIILVNIGSKAWEHTANQLQPKLTAGTNITIENNVISATGGASYTAGNGINIADNTISTKLGNGLKHTDDGKITLSAADRSISVGEFGVHVPVITTSLDITDNGIAVKLADNTIEAYNSGTGTKGIRVNQNVIQPKLTAGDNVAITNNVISAIDTKLATQITLGQAITAQSAIGGIPAGKVYAATDTLATLLTDLLGGTAPAGDGYIYYGVGSTIPTSVEGMTKVAVQKDTLLSSGYIWKNISANNEYVYLAIDSAMGLDCYQIEQSGFALGFNVSTIGNQKLYTLTDKITDTGMRLTYLFEEV